MDPRYSQSLRSSSKIHVVNQSIMQQPQRQVLEDSSPERNREGKAKQGQAVFESTPKRMKAVPTTTYGIDATSSLNTKNWISNFLDTLPMSERQFGKPAEERRSHL